MNNVQIYSIIRIKSIMIDVLFTGVVTVFASAIALILSLNSNVLFMSFVLAFIYSTILCKDFVNAKSMGKYKYNLQIVNINNSKASVIKLIVRNLFIIIWPVELLFCIVNPERRIADFVLNTKLIYNKSDKRKIIIERRNYITFVIVILILTILFYSIVKILSISNSIVQLLYN